jgi:hypothetical protein
MARMTALDMVTEVRLHLGGETEETLSDNQILRWINRAYIDCASSYKFDELEASTSITTSSGTAEYPIPFDGATDMLTIMSITDDTNNLTLQPWSRRQYDRAVQGSAASITGPPVFWFKSGVGTNSGVGDSSTDYTVGQFTFYPTPAGTYTINIIYRQKPAELVLTPAATSCSLLEPWDEVLILRAVRKGWMALGDDDKAYRAKQAADEQARLAQGSSFTPSSVATYSSSYIGRALSGI